MTRIRAALLLAAVLLVPLRLGAQQVRVRGYGDADLDALMRSALAAHPLIITRDTLVPAHDTIHGNVVVVKARFILEGTIAGDLTGLGANIYLRPAAHVTGQVANVAGGYYPSELAKVGNVEDRPLAPYHITRSDGGYVIEGTVTRPAMRLLGGMRMPEYNRVDGLRVEVGPQLLLNHMAGVEPIITGSIGYATERKDFFGRAELLLKRGRSTLAAGWEDDVTLTNDEWIRRALNNSIAFLWAGHDYRNYYAADRTYVEFRRVLERGPRTSQYWVRGQNETAHSLVAGDPYIIWKPDSIRFNDPVPHTRIASVIVGVNSVWSNATSLADLTGSIEIAGNRGTSADYAFNAYRAQLIYAMKALANHTLQVTANFRGPLPGTDSLPLQRWTFVGGSNTLYTFRLNEFRGDRLAFVETEYRIPFRPELRLPLLGRPTLRLMHNVGMAWSHDVKRDFEQNIGARIQFPLAYARVVTNPRKLGDKVLFDVGVSFPSRAYPWEKVTQR